VRNVLVRGKSTNRSGPESCRESVRSPHTHRHTSDSLATRRATVIQLSRRVHLQTDIESHTNNVYRIAGRFKGSNGNHGIHSYRTLTGSDCIFTEHFSGPLEQSARCVCVSVCESR